MGKPQASASHDAGNAVAADIAFGRLLSVVADTCAGDRPSCALGWKEELALEGHVAAGAGEV